MGHDWSLMARNVLCPSSAGLCEDLGTIVSDFELLSHFESLLVGKSTALNLKLVLSFTVLLNVFMS